LCTVKEKIGELTYKLIDDTTKKELDYPVHCDNMRHHVTDVLKTELPTVSQQSSQNKGLDIESKKESVVEQKNEKNEESEKIETKGEIQKKQESKRSETLKESRPTSSKITQKQREEETDAKNEPPNPPKKVKLGQGNTEKTNEIGKEKQKINDQGVMTRLRTRQSEQNLRKKVENDNCDILQKPRWRWK
jgi:outer membrane biosynthesis protein TonB